MIVNTPTFILVLIHSLFGELNLSAKLKGLSSLYSFLLIVPLLTMSSLLLPFLGYNLPQEDQSTNQSLTSLREPFSYTPSVPQSGIYRNKDSLNSPYYSITSIDPDKAIYFPGETISVTNRFNSSQTGPLAIVSQVISIYLHKHDYGDLTDANHLITTAKTNGTPTVPSISFDLTEGIIDVSFAIPDMSELTNTYGISPGDNVSIYQYYPGGSSNVTAEIENVNAFAKVDYFIVSGFSTLAETSPGFVNTASSDSTFRQGEEATVVLKAQSGTTPISGLTVDVELRNGATHTLIPNGGQGINYNLLDMTTSLPSTTTDTNGELRLNVTTTYPTTPENDYYFILNTTIDPVSGYFTENYDGSDPTTNWVSSTSNFTVQNEMDIASLELVSAVPSSSIDPPNVNSTLVTFRVNIDYVYTSDVYQVAGIPINASLDSYPTGVDLQFGTGFLDNGTGWAQTNGSGMVQFVVTAGFPIPYQSKTPIITAFADLRNSDFPGGAYPSSYPNNFHMYIRSSGGALDVSSGGDMISIDPEFWIGDIHLNSITASSIRPGESSTLVFEVNSTSTLDDFSGVPVKIELNQVTPGVSLSFNALRNPLYANGYRYTDSSGMIEVTVNSIYLTTPEILKTIILDLTVDFENDSQVRWIGDQHQGTATFAQWNKSWRTKQDTNLNIDPNFTTYEIILATTNESGDTTIRSGDVLEIDFRVQQEGGGAGLAGVDVSVVFGGVYAGVSFVYVGGSTTNGSGYVTIQLTTTFLTTPKILDIVINATADLTSDPGVWLVGQKATNPSFYSSTSYSDVEETVTVNPQYFFGEITAYPADNPVTRIGQTEWINIEFTLYLSGAGTVFPNIDDVNISIQVDGKLPGDPTINMNVIPVGSYQDSAVSKAIFSLQPTGTTPEKWYTVNATAHFGDAQGLTYNISHSSVPSGELSGVWVNGSHTNTISSATFNFEVKNVDRIQVLIQDPINDITDGTHPDAGLNATTGYYEVYRGTTSVNISGSYYDPVASMGVPFTTVRLAYNITIPSSQTITLTNVVTDANGEFSAIITIPGSTQLQDIQIYGWDPATPTPQENRNPITNVRLISWLSISGHTLSGYDGNSVFVGESVISSGTIRDDQNSIVDSSQFIGLMRNIGYDGSQEVGSPSFGSLTSGSFTLSYQIPTTYPLNGISIRSKVVWGPGLIHYRPRFFAQPLNVYNAISISSFEIYLPANGSTIPIANGGTYYIVGDSHRQINILGDFVDQINRGLVGKELNDDWNGSFPSVDAGSGGAFNFDHTFTGFTSVSWIWSLSHRLDNGTTLSTTFIVTFNWIAIDDTAPSITLMGPSNIETIAQPNNPITQIFADIFDPDRDTGIGYVSLGMNYSSIMITIDGASFSMTNITNTRFTFDWDTSSAVDQTYFISITAYDNARNLRNVSFYAVIDVVDPMATISASSITSDSTVYATMNSNGDILISGTISDSSSSTGRDSGVNNPSVSLDIQPQGDVPVLSLNNVALNVSGNSFNYNWNIFDTTFLIRNSTFDLLQTTWELIVTVSDTAGNANETVLTIELEDEVPALLIEADPPPTIAEGTFEIGVSFYDLKSGINVDFIRFTLFNADDNTELQTYDPTDTEVSLIADTNASLTLNADILNNGNYMVVITVFDNTGNSRSVDSDNFVILHPVTTTDVPSTTTEPPSGGPGVLRPIDLIQFILLDIIALGSGIGIAVIFERVKARRKG